jgi:hypothetical protein
MARDEPSLRANPSARIAEGEALFGVARVAMLARAATKVKVPARKLVAKRVVVKVPTKSKVLPTPSPKASASVKKVVGSQPAGGKVAAAKPTLKPPLSAPSKAAGKASKKTMAKAVRKAS